MRNCEICRHIKDYQSSNIGRNEYFSDDTEHALSKLEELGQKWHYGKYYVLRCSLCHTYYFHYVEDSFTGTGFSDNQSLYRAEFRADDQIGKQGYGYYNEMADILLNSDKKDDPEIKEIIKRCRDIKFL